MALEARWRWGLLAVGEWDLLLHCYFDATVTGTSYFTVTLIVSLPFLTVTLIVALP